MEKHQNCSLWCMKPTHMLCDFRQSSQPLWASGSLLLNWGYNAGLSPYNLLKKKAINSHIQWRDYHPHSELPSPTPLFFIKALKSQCAKDMDDGGLPGQHLPFWILLVLIINIK